MSQAASLNWNEKHLNYEIETYNCDYMTLKVPEKHNALNHPLDRNALRLKDLLKDRSLLYPRLKYLRSFYLSTIGEGEICFQPEVYPNALTRLGQRFGVVNIITTETHPIVTTAITFDSNCFDWVSLYFTVFMEGEPRIKTTDLDTVTFKFIACLGESHRVIFMSGFDMRQTCLAGLETPK